MAMHPEAAFLYHLVQLMEPALLISCLATAAVYLGVLAPRLQRQGSPAAPLWRYFRNLEAYRDLVDREGIGRGAWWLALFLTAADLCLAMGLAYQRLDAMIAAWQ